MRSRGRPARSRTAPQGRLFRRGNAIIPPVQLEAILRGMAIGAAALLGGLWAGCSARVAPPSQTAELRALGDARLLNAHWLTPRVLAGAQPEGAAGFKDLAALGVRTVISVDGARPDVELARQAG